MNVKFTWPILAFASTAVAAAQQAAPSFDCAKARGRIEKMICADTQLSTLDRHAADLFAIAAAQAPADDDVKRAQRSWLRERDACRDLACLKSQYENRIDTLAAYTGRLPETTVRALCTRLATPEGRAELLNRRSGSESIDNGTTFRFEDRTYVYYSHAGSHAGSHDTGSGDAALAEPAHVSHVTPTNREVRLCEFETIVSSALVEGGSDVCTAVESGERIEPIELTPLAERRSAGRADTYMRRSGSVDIDNDGLDDHVVELSYENGVGRGCTFNYFELLAEDGRSLLTNSKRLPVRELQGLGAEGYRERNCGIIENRLFKFDEKIYYETNVTNNELVPHELRVLDGTAVGVLCTFEREATTRVRRVFVK